MRAVNLIPGDQRGGSTRAPSRSKGGAYAVLGILAGLALLALVYGIAAHQVSDRKAKVQTLEAQVQQAQASAVQLAPYTSFQALREQRVNAVNQLVNSRFDWAHAFHEFGRVLPREISLTSISGTIASTTGPGAAAGAASSAASSSTGATGASTTASSASTTPSSAGTTSPSTAAAVASATPPGSLPTFTLTGCAINQSSVALTLERLRLMDGVKTVSLQSSTKSAGSGGSGVSSGACPVSYPVFNAQVTFEALPVSTTISSGAAKPAKLSGGAR
jgi:Tfp pilus assembly protein PilN